MVEGMPSLRMLTLRTLDCGCRLQAPYGQLAAVSVAFCSLHAAAPQLLETCERVLRWAARANVVVEPEDADMIAAVCAALAAARPVVADMPVVPPPGPPDVGK